MAKGPLEKALEKHQKEIERQVKKQIEADNPYRPFMKKMHQYSQADCAHYETSHNNPII